jgi:hypothetical protein
MIVIIFPSEKKRDERNGALFWRAVSLCIVSISFSFNRKNKKYNLLHLYFFPSFLCHILKKETVDGGVFQFVAALEATEKVVTSFLFFSHPSIPRFFFVTYHGRVFRLYVKVVTG